MRRIDKEITDENVINDMMTKSRICRLGFVDNGEAYIVPVNFAYSEGVIYVHSAHSGKKMDILKQNNRVSFEIEYYTEIIEGERPCDWTVKYRSAMGKGSVIIENDATAKKAAPLSYSSPNPQVVMPFWLKGKLPMTLGWLQSARITSYNVCYTKLLRWVNPV